MNASASPAEHTAPATGRQPWIALIALATGAFLFVTAEAMPVGLLPQIAAGLDVSERSAGLLVTGYAWCVVLTTIPLTAALARLDRRRLLAGLLACYVLGAAVSALAPNYGVLLSARVVMAAAQGVFWAMAAVVAVCLVPPERAGRAIAVVFGGISMAQVVGLPLVTAVGHWLGWRVALAGLAILGTLTLIAVLGTVPALPGSAVPGGRALRPALDNRALLGAVLVTAVTLLAVYLALTYFSPLLREVAGVPAAAVAIFVLLFGLAGIGGNALAGVYIDRMPRAVLRVAVGGVGCALVLFGLIGQSLVGAVAAIVLWGLCGSAIPTAVQAWALSLAPGHPEAAAALLVVGVNAGIGAGALVGGAVFEAASGTGVVWSAAALLGIAFTTLLINQFRWAAPVAAPAPEQA